MNEYAPSMQNRKTERKKQFPFKEKQQGLERVTICSHDLKVVHSVFVPRKEKKIIFLYLYNYQRSIFFLCFWLFFLQTRKTAFSFDGITATKSGREKEFSGLHKSISVYLHHMSVVGSRQAATIITQCSLWFAELGCDWSIHNWPVRMK